MNDAPRLRVDKWLYHARFFKSRSIAGEVAGSGHLRLNGTHVRKGAQTVRPGDTLTFPQADRIRVIRVLAIGVRRGPASEAQALYEDLTPPETPDLSRPRAGPAPDKRARQAARKLRGSALE